MEGVKNVDKIKDESSNKTCSLQTMQLNTNKAGMEGLDTSKINEIIQKASEGSKFYQHKQKCQERINSKIAQMKSLIEKFSSEQILKAEHEMSLLREEMELERDLSRTIVHIDMDMFYAAVEMRDQPSLKTKPMAVGSNSMLSTSNYVARKFGVRAAMPGFIAKKLCPDLVIVSSDFNKYRKVSRQVQEIFKDYDPDFSQMSLDEAYLDITDYLMMHPEEYAKEELGRSAAEGVVDEIRQRIEEKTQLTASAGIAVNTRLAKVCSDLNKPNGQFYLPPIKENIDEFIKTLPIRKIPGIGNVTEQQLKALGVATCSDLWEKRGLLKLLFSESSYIYFLRIALGLGSTEVAPSSERDRKSISNETTFSGTSDKKQLFDICEELCRELKEDMVRKDLYGKVITLKMKTVDFKVQTRAQTLMEPTQDESVMIPVVHKLLTHEMDNEAKNKPLSLRLLGVRMSNLSDKSHLDAKKQITIKDLFNKKTKNRHDYGDFMDIHEEKDHGNVDLLADTTDSIANTTESIANTKDLIANSTESIANTKDSIANTTESIANTKDLIANTTESIANTKDSIANTTDCNIDENSNDSEDLFSEYDIAGPSTIKEDGTLNNSLKNNEELLNDKSSSSVNESIEYTCPVCNKSKYTGIDVLNTHIDLCLNEGLVGQLFTNDNVASTSTKSEPQNFKRKRHSNNNGKKAKKSFGSVKVLHKFLGLN